MAKDKKNDKEDKNEKKNDEEVSPKEEGKKRHRKRNYSKYSLYIYQVLKETDKDLGISTKAMGIMNSLCQDNFERIAREAGHLAKINKRKTISDREIQTAINLIFPTELAQDVKYKGRDAVHNFDGTSHSEEFNGD